jgi:hypothetical protein
MPEATADESRTGKQRDYWCPRPESNGHGCQPTDFKSVAPFDNQLITMAILTRRHFRV